MNKIVSSRFAILKFVGGAAALHLGFTAISKVKQYREDKIGGRMMTIPEYIQSEDIRENTVITIMGTVRPHTLTYEIGTFKKKFTLTDSKFNLECIEEGLSPTELTEGEAIMIKAYCPNLLMKTKIVIKEYSTRHPMETKEWQAKENVNKKAYGVQTFS